MNSHYFIYLHLDDYLAQWFIHEQGGEFPVRLTRGSIEANILEQFLIPQPKDVVVPTEAENPNAVKIILPSFRYKDTRYFNYLPKRAVHLLINCIRNRFDVDLWNSLHKFPSLLCRQDELIYSFMECHDIEINDKNWAAIAKRYQRKRKLYLLNERVKRFRKNRYNFEHQKNDL